MLCVLLLHSKVNQQYFYIYPLFSGFPSHLGHHRALSRVPCAVQQVLILYILSIVYICQSQFILAPFPPWYLYICSLHLCLYFCFANKIIQSIFFLDSTYMGYLSKILLKQRSSYSLTSCFFPKLPGYTYYIRFLSPHRFFFSTNAFYHH